MEELTRDLARSHLWIIRNKIRQVWDTEVFQTLDSDSPYFLPCLVHVLIDLNDGLQICAKIQERCTITENVDPWPNENDLTSLIAAARAAACHIESERRIIRPDGGG